MSKNYKSLQNGSDIRGIAMKNDTGEVNLTQEAARDIAAAFGIWLKKKKGKNEVRVALGRDSRLSGADLLLSAASGLAGEGIEVTSFGMASTPAMFMATVLSPYHFDGSIMITASHLPWYRNGLKFFTDEGGLEKKDIAEIVEIAEKIESVYETKEITNEIDFMSVYAGELVKKIREGVQAEDFDRPLAGLKIIVDAGNGAGGFFVEKVLKELGADTAGSQFLEPDGNFPNHIPNPENKEAAKAIREATVRENADLGIIFDTDVDRGGAVLKGGRDLTGNALIAVLAKIALREHPGTTIVTDSVTSTGLAGFIKANGGVHRRFKRGYKNVIDEAIRLNKEGICSQLAIETSGHGAFKENYFIDDGAYLMAKLLIEMGKGVNLLELVESLKVPAETAEIRFSVVKENVAEVFDTVLSHLEKKAKEVEGWSLEAENFEGVRINCDKEHGDGWILLRKSLHEPIMPLNIESDSEGGVEKMKTALREVLKETEGLDLSVL